MYTLGNKELIVNNSSIRPLSFSTSGDIMHIHGYGSFNKPNLVSAIGQRFVPGRVENMDVTVPNPAQLGLQPGQTNVPVQCKITVYSVRDESGMARDYIKHGKHYIAEIFVNYTDSYDQIGEKIDQAWSQHDIRFGSIGEELPFAHSYPGSSQNFYAMKSLDHYFSTTVEFRTNHNTYRWIAPTDQYTHWLNNVAADVTNDTTIPVDNTEYVRVGDYVRIGAEEDLLVVNIDQAAGNIIVDRPIDATTGDAVEIKSKLILPRWRGKYLEENVRMSLDATRDSYGILPEELAYKDGRYTTVTFEINDEGQGINAYGRHKFLGGTRGELGGDRQFKFTLYFLEGSDLFQAGGYVEQVADFLLNAPDKDFRLWNGQPVFTGSDFIQ